MSKADLPAHLAHMTKAASDALDAARTPAEKASAQRQGERAIDALKAHISAHDANAAFRSAMANPQPIRKMFA